MKLSPAYISFDVAMSMPILHLNLTADWFDLMEQGIKKEEYRQIKAFYSRIFSNDKIKIKGKFYKASEVVVCFSNGYAKNRRQMFFTLCSLAVGYGVAAWGAIPNTQYYILKLKDRIYDNR